MNILGIETSCDENSAAIVSDGRILHANVVYSQVDLHKIYGGVVPEVAARSHIEVMIPVVAAALEQAKMDWEDIDAVAVTKGPGLGGSLLIGSLTARTLALIKNKPLYGLSHVLGHVYANFIDWTAAKAELKSATAKWQEPEFPLLALIVSGGHTQLVLFKDHFDYQLLGQTQDDAVGEAFDKVAKIVGLPYPGGPSIQSAAQGANANFLSLPKAKLDNEYDFSYSGLKTAVLRAVQELVGVDYDFPSFELKTKLSEAQVKDIAASFQKVAIETLVDKTELAFNSYQPKTVVIAGGVAANTELRHQLSRRLPLEINYAPISLCTDNAAMMAALGYYHAQQTSPDDVMTMKIAPSLSM